ncbi:phage holin family protein [Sphingomicrobium lutaoense]|uniref:Putative membrane protein YqjE n=1 Tax=Sphingomicrobium lutaoense TaxID=515949 RepID=A0A839YZH7_9SPHN|nr:phage holin family protein [Sphingomicrobium lutaoense]MBB3763728.1 putative membrane protein YqjE [Sphingomicrobium lutaoense]
MLDKSEDPQQFDADKGIGDMLGKVVADARELAEAEVELAKVKALSHANRYRRPAILLGAALLFAIAGVVALILTIGAALATLIGPLGGGLIATLIALAIAGGLAMWAKSSLENIE